MNTSAPPSARRVHGSRLWRLAHDNGLTGWWLAGIGWLAALAVAWR